MPCIPTTIGEIENFIKNKQNIYSVNKHQTVQVTLDHLEHTQRSFAKIAGQYNVTGGNAPLATTITTVVGQKVYKNPPAPNPVSQAKADIGNFIHATSEVIVNDIKSQLTGNFDQDYAFIKAFDKTQLTANARAEIAKVKQQYGRAFSQDAAVHIVDGLKSTLGQIYSFQKQINKKTGLAENPVIFSELVLIDPQNDMGGTADLVAVFSDNTASVYDFKTKILSPGQKDPTGKLLQDIDLFSKTDESRFKMQLSLIGKILREKYGVSKINSSVILPVTLNMKFNKVNNTYDPVVNNLYFAKHDPNLHEIRPLPETTGLDKLDEFLNKNKEHIRKLKDRMLKTTDKHTRDELNKRIKELENNIAKLFETKNFNAFISYINTLVTKSDSDLDAMELTELFNFINEVKLMSGITTAGSEIKFLYSSNTKQDFEDKVKEIHIKITDILKSAEYILYNKKMAQFIHVETGTDIIDGKGNIIPFNDEGMLGKIFNQLSEYDNPVFQAFKSVLDKKHFQYREDVNTLLKEMQTVNRGLKGISNTELFNILINKTTGNFYSKIDPSFYQKTQSFSVPELVANFDPPSWYQQWYSANAPADPAALAIFDITNDLSLDSNGVPYNPKAWVKFMKMKALKIKPSVINANLSAEYKTIQSRPEILALYEIYTKYNEIFRSITGAEYFDLPNNFMPNIRKDMFERMEHMGVVDGSVSTMKDFIQSFSVRQDDVEFGELEDGEVQKKVPLFFLNPFRNEDGSIDLENKSFEFSKSLVLFGKVIYNYKYMSETEDLALLFKTFLSEKGEEYIRRNEKVARSPFGELLQKKINKDGLDETFQKFVDMYIYGIKVKPTLGDKTGTIEKNLLAAKQYMTLKSLGLNAIAAGGSFIAANSLARLEGHKEVIYTREQHNAALKTSATERNKFLSIYAFFDPMNILFDNFSTDGSRSFIGDMTRDTVIKRYVSSRTMMAVFSKGDEYIDEVVLNAMSRNYYLDANNKVRRMKSDIDREQFKNRSIYNLYDANTNTIPGVTKDELRQIIIDFRNAVQSGQNKIKGVISEEDKAAWQNDIILNLLMQFKSWAPGLIKDRMGKLRYNQNIQSVEMGKYVALGKEFYNVDGLATRVFVKDVFLPKLGKFIAIILFGYLSKKMKLNDDARKRAFFDMYMAENPYLEQKITYDEFVEIQQKQVQSMVIELRVILAFMTMIALLAGDWDDDGEKDYKEYQAIASLIKMLKKAESEMGFMYNPVEFSKMIANPLPILRLVTDVWNTIKNTTDETRDVVSGEESNYDKTPVMYYTHGWFPGASGAAKLFGVFEN